MEIAERQHIKIHLTSQRWVHSIRIRLYWKPREDFPNYLENHQDKLEINQINIQLNSLDIRYLKEEKSLKNLKYKELVSKISQNTLKRGLQLNKPRKSNANPLSYAEVSQFMQICTRHNHLKDSQSYTKLPHIQAKQLTSPIWISRLCREISTRLSATKPASSNTLRIQELLKL